VAFIEPTEEQEVTEELVDEPQEEVIQQQVETPAEDDLPPKYKGKTAKEIAQMHIEAEKLIGKHAQEVGEVRRMADELLKRQLEQKKEPAPVEDEVDFFEDPDKAVNRKIESHPAIQQARQQALELKQMQTLNRLRQDFPDFQNVVHDPDFAEWVKASPVRIKLYAQADGDFDFDAASELLTTWKYVKPSQQTTQAVSEPSQEAVKAQKQAVKSATVDVGGTAGPGKTSKIYRRIDLIRLNLEDPERYEAMQEEIMAAYREGRVK
jgi:hypothetical protein